MLGNSNMKLQIYPYPTLFCSSVGKSSEKCVIMCYTLYCSLFCILGQSTEGVSGFC